MPVPRHTGAVSCRRRVMPAKAGVQGSGIRLSQVINTGVRRYDVTGSRRARTGIVIPRRGAVMRRWRELVPGLPLSFRGRRCGVGDPAPGSIACYNPRPVRPPGGMVDAADLKSEAERRGGSNPPAGRRLIRPEPRRPTGTSSSERDLVVRARSGLCDAGRPGIAHTARLAGVPARFRCSRADTLPSSRPSLLVARGIETFTRYGGTIAEPLRRVMVPARLTRRYPLALDGPWVIIAGGARIPHPIQTYVTMLEDYQV